MSTLYLCRGYSASGKSTYAREWVAQEPENRINVNRDDLRAMLTADCAKKKVSYDLEQQVTRLQREAAKDALKAGKDVIVSDTNLVLRFAREWANLASDAGAGFEVVDFHTGLEDCLLRNAVRENRVPDQVIRDQASRFPFKQWQEVQPKQRVHGDPPKPYIGDPMLPLAIIVDIDGTLAHAGDRDIYDGFAAGDDTLDEIVSHIVETYESLGYKIIVMSGRGSQYRQVTEQWLAKHAIWYDELLMRTEGDNRPDFVIKGELFDAHVREHYNVKFALDDRDQIVRLWREMGLKCLQVQPGDF